jgi:2-methylisocitrate lyase-like PEP mutase family enzyme
MSTQAEKAEAFLALHQGDAPLLLPNPWDVGSAKILATIGFSA